MAIRRKKNISSRRKTRKSIKGGRLRKRKSNRSRRPKSSRSRKLKSNKSSRSRKPVGDDSIGDESVSGVYGGINSDALKIMGITAGEYKSAISGGSKSKQSRFRPL